MALLQAMQDGQPHQINDLKASLELSGRQVSDAATHLRLRGLATSVQIGVYKLSEKGIQAAKGGVRITSGPRVPHGKCLVHNKTFRQRAWRAIRMRKSFTFGDIAADAGRGEERQDTENAARFIRQLSKAGIVAALPRRVKGSTMGSNGFKKFILLKDLGPLVPVYRPAQNCFHDFNSGEDLPCNRA